MKKGTKKMGGQECGRTGMTAAVTVFLLRYGVFVASVSCSNAVASCEMRAAFKKRSKLAEQQFERRNSIYLLILILAHLLTHLLVPVLIHLLTHLVLLS
jgi:hypothetical protein